MRNKLAGRNMKRIISGTITVITAILLIFSTACIRIVAPGGNDSGTVTPPNQQPVAYIATVSPATVSLGDPVTFNGYGIDSDGVIIGYEWQSNIDGLLSTSATFTTMSLTLGTHIVSLRVLDNNNSWSAEAKVIVTVNPKIAKPAIEMFTVSPGNVFRGNPIELRWRVSGATTVFIDNGIGQVDAAGSKMIFPAVNTLYTLTALNESGSVTATAFVTVLESTPTGNPVINFTANHLGGTSWQLIWNVLNATQVVIEPDVGSVNPAGSTVVTVPSGQTKTYRLTATNSWGWAYWQVILVSP